MSRSINSDILGAKGEHRFGELCLDAGLNPNKPERDRYGWDFLIEFPYESLGAPHDLAGRGQPLECRVQLKTVWEDQRKIKLRLSAAERLAKAETPTFICVLRVNRALMFASLHVAHVAGDLLDRILSELRRMEAANKTLLINKRFLEIPFDACSSAIPVSGSALKELLIECVGGSYRAYVDAKVKTLRSAGFTAHRYHGAMTVTAPSDQALLDFSLGLQPLEALSFEVLERRYGIDLPMRLPSAVREIRVNPGAIDVRVIFLLPKNRPVILFMQLVLPVFRHSASKLDGFLLRSSSLHIKYDGIEAHLAFFPVVPRHVV